MKKVFLFAIALVAISFASCSNKGTADTAAATDSTAVVVEEVQQIVTDSVDSAAIVIDEVAVSEVPAN